MEKTINAAAKTPEVIANTITGEISIIGVIIPENPIPFFISLNELIEQCKTDSNSLIINFDLEYFNTGAARYLYEMMKKLKDYPQTTINWHYELDDEDIYESGIEFKELSGLSFNFIVKDQF